MSKFASIALAGAVAVSAVAMTATGASAGGWRQHYQPQYQPHYYAPRSYDPGPAIVAGAIFGLALGALAQPQPYYYAPYPAPPPAAYYPRYSSPHFDWCTATYESYNGETDTWTDFRGVVRRCIGPY